MQTVIGGGSSQNTGAPLPPGMTDADLARKNLYEANQVNALRVGENGVATNAFDSSGKSTGGWNTPAQNPGILSSRSVAGSISDGVKLLPNGATAKAGDAGGLFGSMAGGGNVVVGGGNIAPSVQPPAPASGILRSAAPQLGLPASWKITPDQTVEGRIGALTNPNNPFIQQARARADGRSNERGLLNSSMALSAADSAAYDAAIPIATADAATAAKAAGYNADQLYQTDVKNLDAATNFYGINTTANTQKYVADQNAATQQVIAKLNNEQQTMITKLGQQNQQLLQNSQVASAAYDTYARTLYNNSINKDMPPEARYQADQNAYHVYQQQLSLSSKLLGVPDVSGLLDFTSVDPNKKPPPNLDPTQEGPFTGPASAPPGKNQFGRPGGPIYTDNRY